MSHEHHYKVTTTWEGNRGTGTSGVRDYDRTHVAEIDGKTTLHLSTDNRVVGDPKKHNPEDLLVAALSSCHMLSYLYLCSLNGIVVTDYIDNSEGIMLGTDKDGGKFQRVILAPFITVKETSMIEKAESL